MSQENMVREALARFAIGDGLTNRELSGLLNFFRRSESMLVELTKHFNPEYGLVLKDVRANLSKLESFKHHRENH